jgi:bacteriocin biosynthesis cyclodehydratase domain-containing protein
VRPERPVRPVLSPAVRRLWRDRETLQLGRPPGRAAVLAGLDAATRAVLPLLDGTRDADQVVAAADAAGCPPDRTSVLLELLGRAGALEDGDATRRAAQRWSISERDRFEPDLGSLSLVHGDGAATALARRSAARVTVLGAGRVGAPLAALLAAAGVGGVDVRDEAVTAASDVGVGGLAAEDVGRRRGEAARALLHRGWPGADLGVQPFPELVVLAPTGREPLDPVAGLVAHGVPHLLVEVRDDVGIVGPLVLPGSTACLHCLDLARSDRDPDWPALAAQLAGAQRTTPPCDGALAVAVAAQAALQALTLLEGTVPASAGGTLELVLPDWRWRRRSWLPHAACGCALPAAG